jgi:hypothetical protein
MLLWRNWSRQIHKTFLLSLTLHFITIYQNSLIDNCTNSFLALSKKEKYKIAIINTTKLSPKHCTYIKQHQIKGKNSQLCLWWLLGFWAEQMRTNFWPVNVSGLCTTHIKWHKIKYYPKYSLKFIKKCWFIKQNNFRFYTCNLWLYKYFNSFQGKD